MHIPFVPLPDFLVADYPRLVSAHQDITLIFAFGCTLFGILILILWAGSKPSDQGLSGTTAREWTRMGFGMIGLAVVALVFGLYFVAILGLAFGMFCIYAIFAGLKTAFGKQASM